MPAELAKLARIEVPLLPYAPMGVENLRSVFGGISPVRKALHQDPAGGIHSGLALSALIDELEKMGRPGVQGKIVVYDAPFVTYRQTVAYRAQGASRAAKLGAVAALVREGGLPSALWAGPEKTGRAVREGRYPVQGTVRTKAVGLRLGFAGDDFGYAIDLGLPAGGGQTAFALDPEIKRESICPQRCSATGTTAWPASGRRTAPGLSTIQSGPMTAC